MSENYEHETTESVRRDKKRLTYLRGLKRACTEYVHVNFGPRNTQKCTWFFHAVCDELQENVLRWRDRPEFRRPVSLSYKKFL